MKEIIELSGKAAVFVKGFMRHYAPGKPLRECQNAGREAVEDLGEEISNPYISKLARQLTDAGVVGKRKVGRHYVMRDALLTKDFLDYIDGNQDWGEEIFQEAVNEVVLKKEIIDFVEEHKGVLIHADRQLTKAAYSTLTKKFKKGELMMAFIEPGTTGVKVDGVTYKLSEYND